jgi:hypothetical protein
MGVPLYVKRPDRYQSISDGGVVVVGIFGSYTVQISLST